MINVVGASQDSNQATNSTIYNFTPSPKQPPTANKVVGPKILTNNNKLQKTSFITKLFSFIKNLGKSPLSSPNLNKEVIPNLPEPTPSEIIIAEPINIEPSLPENLTNESSEAILSKSEIKNSEKPKANQKILKLSILIGILAILVIGVIATIYLTQSSQDIRQQASEKLPSEKNLNSNTSDISPEPTAEPVLELMPTVKTGQANTIGGLADMANPDLRQALLQNSVLAGDKLSLASTLTPSPTFTSPTIAPTLTPQSNLTDTKPNCNDSCLKDENCLNKSHNCYQGICRLSSNLTNSNCMLASGGSQLQLTDAAKARTYSLLGLPTGEAPISGPKEWLLYALGGFSLVFIGGLTLLFL